MSTASAPVSSAAGSLASPRAQDVPRTFVGGQIHIYYTRRNDHTATPEHVDRVQVMTASFETMQRPISLAQAEELAQELEQLCPEYGDPRDSIMVAGGQGTHRATSHLLSLPEDVVLAFQEAILAVAGHPYEFRFHLTGGCVDVYRAGDDDGFHGDFEPTYNNEEYDESDFDSEDEAYNEVTYRNLVASAAEDMRRYLNVYESEDLRIQREEAEEDEARIDEMEGWTTMHLTSAGQESLEEHLGHPTAYRALVRIRRGFREAREPIGLARQLRYVHLGSDSE
ncbi:hypothetical protein LTR78_001928 [Recurvomyces mirabilis]|uniref:Uncharacterized protein n=1 Tax=Recurvomyces mirabilis TaxID=574656 RepID=A0AAE0WV05_9PEZI|nr:hypothetical protein LTR78_001928 [Recurvomyces mirabilis]KAK5156633.1 hypothetical protein LTS14_004845 [Recurvomyces mirabilis]